MADGFALKFVALGDSLTVGFQPPGIFLPGREAFPYTRFLDIILSGELPRKGLGRLRVSFRNAGMLGDTVRSMLERFDGHVAAEEPDYVIVWGGINDLFMLRDPESIAGDLKRIYGRALEAGIGPIACAVTSVIGPDDIIPRVMELNQLIRGHCNDHGVPLADLFAATSDESGRLRETFSSDGVHLSQAGYRRVAHTIYYEAIEPILNGLKK
ncbi:hypothetical protein AC482_04860 [miscellaneous Crenarchaeota group-15 archaeon DG-45]|uniref:SGNH hydrolase-type esterase domain-containing protein n=1 Tax=miscellaneous Crenarchaeota group-15 archaeon DG-45 TaxID=1685127 RepID=A0A0M0BNA5_9ARCH|nr:MAG: hypothetical protein AC482_04860 [miscellaneous Crenarchaeota group-15 archaeon DG-45]